MLNQKKIRVVWLEDAKFLRELFLELVVVGGWLEKIDLIFLDDGDEAERELTRRAPDIFVTDIEHPGLHAGIMLEKLDVKKATYPILIVTGCNPEIIKGFTAVRCPNLNVTVIEKPFATEELLMTFGSLYEAASKHLHLG